MESMTPTDLFVIIGICLVVLAGSIAYDSRANLLVWLGSVKGSRADYGQDPADDQPDDQPVEGASTLVAATGNEGSNPIAMGSNERNDVLTRNERLRVQADAVAALLESGSIYIPDGKGSCKKAGQVKLIKLVTGLSPNGRPDSDYGIIRAELDRLTTPVMTVTEGSEVRTIEKG